MTPEQEMSLLLVMNRTLDRLAVVEQAVVSIRQVIDKATEVMTYQAARIEELRSENGLIREGLAAHQGITDGRMNRLDDQLGGLFREIEDHRDDVSADIAQIVQDVAHVDNRVSDLAADVASLT